LSALSNISSSQERFLERLAMVAAETPPVRTKRKAMMYKAIALSAALLMGTAVFGVSNAAGLETRNKALVDAINGAQADAQAGRWTDALAKAKQADAIRDDKPTSLNPVIHEMIINYAISAKDWPAAMDQLEKNVRAGEGNKNENLKKALSIAITAKDKAKTDQFAKELGGNLDNPTRLFIANQMAQAGQLREALDYAKPALEGNASEEALKFQQAIAFKMNDAAGRRAALEQLVANYPKLEYWHDLLQIARNEHGLSDEQQMDIYRLRLALGDLKTVEDYTDMAQEALVAGYPAEAKAVLEKAQAAKLLKGERWGRLVTKADTDASQNAAVQSAMQKKAASDPNTGVKLGMMYLSFSKTKEAEEAIRSAMASGKLADPDAAKIALGHVLYSEGKKQDALNAFNSVAKNGKEASIGRLWAIYARRG
jgi:hypothetical protein